MDNNNEKYSRLEAIYNKDKLNKFFKANIVLIGIGGVGSYCANSLVRSGIKNLTIIDFDCIEASNINRQLFANENTIAQKKVNVAKKFLKSINSQLNLTTYENKILNLNFDEVFKDCNYIIDAIDDIKSKLEIAKYAQNNKIPIISCMGTAMKKDASFLAFADIYETSVCPLCKNFRKLAKNAGIERLEVLYSTEPSYKSLNGQLGSTSYLPPIAGMMLAGRVIEAI